MLKTSAAKGLQHNPQNIEYAMPDELSAANSTGRYIMAWDFFEQIDFCC